LEHVLELEHVDLVYRSAESLSFKRLFNLGKKSVVNEFKALDDVSITIEKGNVYGIIGNNGAGKSTLLRVLSGVMAPNKGNVIRNYKSINLLALGIGFSKELTGLDNIYLSGMLLGFSKKHIKAVLTDIIDYSELDTFIYRAMKTYSSGMVSRLAFSIAIHLRPEVLLIDEVLSVGDMSFREKSFNSLNSIIKDKDTTVLIVSHSMDQIDQICDKIIWLDKGKVIMQGDKFEILESYTQYSNGKLLLSEIIAKPESVSFVNGKIDIDISNYSPKLSNTTDKYLYKSHIDSIKEFSLSAGKLKLTKRILPNKDIFMFFEYDGSADSLNIFFDKITDTYIYDYLYKKPPFDNRYGENKLTGLYAYLDLRQGSACISKIHHYKELTFSYTDESVSIVYELIKESDDISIINNDCLNFSIGNKKGTSTFFILVSKQKLFRDKENMNKYMEYYYQALYNNSVWNSFFTTPSGTYTKLPYSIEPFSKDGYGYSLHHSSKKDMFPFFNQTKERFFESFLSNAVLQAYLYQKQYNGLFLTTYTSTWLKKNTGIIAPYIDTRFNETFILMLKDLQETVSYFNTLDPMRDYVNFFYQLYKNSKNLYLIDDGVFFPDYFKHNNTSLSHTSLNHQLGIAQMLLSAWKKYSDSRYLDVFTSMIKFIDYTCHKWKNDNNDLFYSIRMDAFGNFEFFDNDYVYVTLLDLLIVQNSCVDNAFGQSASLDWLINVKLDFLKTTEYNIFSSNPKKASGERVDSAKLALKFYNNLYDSEVRNSGKIIY
jgi:ABC-type polysaccharide/polyol phosphate transport system ATPase subunit